MSTERCIRIYATGRPCPWDALPGEQACSKHGGRARLSAVLGATGRCSGTYGTGRCPWNVASGLDTCSWHATAVLLGAEAVGPPPDEESPQPPVPVHDVLPEVVGGGAVVYYLGDPVSQLIKIGTTTRLRRRMHAIRRTRHRTLVLATEPGGYDVETQRHGEYRRFNVDLGTGEREWFRRAPLLMTHVTETRHRHGIICPGYPIDFSVIAPVRRHRLSG